MGMTGDVDDFDDYDDCNDNDDDIGICLSKAFPLFSFTHYILWHHPVLGRESFFIGNGNWSHFAGGPSYPVSQLSGVYSN